MTSINPLTLLTGIHTDSSNLFSTLNPLNQLLGINNDFLGEGFEEGDGVFDLELNTVVDYSYSAGSITVTNRLDRKGITITINRDFGEGYLGYFALVRGRYEYKQNYADFNAHVVYEEYSFEDGEIEILDSNVAKGVHYYYTLLPVFGPNQEQAFILFNPKTSSGTGYVFKNYNHQNIMYNLLPDQTRLKAEASPEGENNLTKRFMGYSGYLFDSLKTDLEVYVCNANDIWNIQLDQLDNLASKLNWVTNKELTGIGRRRELEELISVYKKKGTLEGMEALISLVSGLDVCYEYGRDRLITSNSVGGSVDWDEPSHSGVPSICIENEEIGTSDGTASQAFDLPANSKDYIITINEETWVQVDDLSEYDSDSLVFSVVSEQVVFGDGVNGAIPENTEVIYLTYTKIGDTGYYSVEYNDGWKNSLGVRAVINATDFDGAINQNVLFKINKIFQAFKPLYLNIDLTIMVPDSFGSTDLGNDVIGALVSEFSDTVTSISLMKFDTSNHTFDAVDLVIG